MRKQPKQIHGSTLCSQVFLVLIISSKRGLDVCSFGTNHQVKIPGPSPDKPNVYSFGTSYDFIYNELKTKDEHLYTQNGLLQMLDRNRKIKDCPQRFQETTQQFDVIFTCEERCFDIVCEEFLSRSKSEMDKPVSRTVYILNFDIKDNHEDATIGARAILQMAQLIESMERDIFGSETVDSALEKCREKYPSFSIVHSVFFY